MSKPATGELRHLADGFAARITIQGRERKDFVLPTCATDADAGERCAAMASMATRLRRAGQAEDLVSLLEMAAKARAGRPWEAVCTAVETLCSGHAPPRKGDRKVPTLTDWGKDWTSGKLAKTYPDHVAAKNSDNDELILRVYIVPHVGDVPVDEFTLEHADFVMANLPELSRHRRPLTSSTRRQVAQVMGRLMNLAVYPGRWRKDSPIPRGWLPKPGAPKAKECLYPDEDALLLGGKSVERGKLGPLPDVPLLRRLAYGFLAREGMRADEMGRLRWRDVDLERGRVALDENKTDDPRDWALRPDVVLALSAWKALQGEKRTEPGDHVFSDQGSPINAERLAEQLRADLERVGVDRPQLFERTKTRQPIRAHDLRATFITVSLATGKTETWVMDRTGHTTSAMVNRYRRKARSWQLGELGPLDACIPELREVRPENDCPTHYPTSHARTWRNWQTHQIQVLAP